MTRAVRDRILKDANGDIGDHLRNHIHLTNCIHLKNHMHKHSPMMYDRSLMRDLMVLQRSRSLRDPSASPPSWHSPLATDMLTKSGEVVSFIGRRMSTGVDRRKVGRKLSRSSPQQDSAAASNVNTVEAAKVTSEHSCMSGSVGGGKGKKKHAVERSQNDENGNELAQENAMARNGQKSHVIEKSLSEQLSDVPGDGEDVASSNIHLHGRQSQREGASEKVEPSGRASHSGINRVRRNKFRRMKRTQASAPTKENRALNEPSVASNSSFRALGQQGYGIEEQGDDCGEDNVTRIPRNGCGIPWNWSRIHHRSKSFFDMAGKSLSCGLSDSRQKRGGSMSQGRDMSDLPKASGGPSSCSESDAEAAPLLVDGYGSQETSENAAWEHDYSGELGIFANSLLKQETESDFASDSRSGAQDTIKGSRHGIHQSLTQKYMPRSFRDLVGQNLVVQALSNAVVRRKMALLYVFHGPHGTGKTSCARILARALNCQSREHPKPCGSCSSCITHDLGKSKSIKEIGSVSNLDFESIMDLLDSMMMVSQQGSQYRVFIFDDCDTLSANCWSAISKVIDRAPRRVVFMLICSSLDILPHAIISRCQKFFFPKLKDADIIYALQWIATKEGLEIDKDALKLIASRSDGSLRDAEMTLEQLSLLGQRISVSLVQELIGLISDEKLVELLDLALSADTVNTVKNLREVMETGVEPLALMSQLATVITDILAGSYDFMKARHKRKFFKQPTLAKEDMEKLRQALKTLSEAEKQLRTSNDKLTWLTAALLQLAPDRQYMLPNTSFNHSPLVLNDKVRRQAARKSDVGQSVMSYGIGLDSRNDRLHAGSSGDVHGVTKFNASSVDRRKHSSSRIMSQQISSVNTDAERVKGRKSISKSCSEIDEIWLDVLDKIQISCIKEFLYQEGKLISVSYSTAPTVHLKFSSYQTKTKAEKFRAYIIQAFESTFGCPVLVEMRTESRKDVTSGANAPVIVPTFEGGSSQINMNSQFTSENCVPLHNGLKQGSSEIVEVATTPSRMGKGNPEHSRVVLAGASQKPSNMASQSEQMPRELNQCRSIIRSKVSLAHVIQQAEGSGSHSSWTKRKAVSIAEKLEQENMRLEPRTRSLLCWKVSRSTRRKICQSTFPFTIVFAPKNTNTESFSAQVCFLWKVSVIQVSKSRNLNDEQFRHGS
ncbi:hypothetical protein V2J09_006540 [Rumex salicifolius]